MNPYAEEETQLEGGSDGAEQDSDGEGWEQHDDGSAVEETKEELIP